MKEIKKLANQTAIYGLSTVVPRFLNWLLVPYFTRYFAPDAYGIVTELYAYVTFLVIILTYGMETSFFRYYESEKDRKKTYSTTLFTLLITSILFIAIVILNQQKIANLLQYQNNPEYIKWFAIILGIDSFISIPFARLRSQGKAVKFSFIKIINVVINISANIFFITICPIIIKNNPESFIKIFYNQNIGVGYIFISNLIASSLTMMILIPDILKVKFEYDIRLIKKMLRYALPLLIAGLAGNINEALDRILLKYLLPENENALAQLGIYGANIKIAVIMLLFIQMFRYAFEPFFFKKEKDKDAKEVFSQVAKYFVIIGLGIFLAVNFYIDIIKYYEDPAYWEGLTVVPVILFGYLLYGLFINLSVWYKIKDLTKFGAYFTITGAIITIIINVLFIPKIGYMASAWARVFCYGIMVLMSYALSRKYYAVNYPVKKIMLYMAFAIALFIISRCIKIEIFYLKLIFNTILLLIYIFVIEKKEKVIKRLILKK